MCKDCCKTQAPDRGRTCHEGGCYFLNFKGCAACKKLDEPTSSEATTETNEDGEEETVFNHVCKHCGHVIAKHTYTFKVEDGYQEYTMVCRLCGRGADSASVLPDDPRKAPPLF
mmetsp:Transcript_16585/g.43045  ORF Transcript_16585/g.43045 Transcript_16585/m.43045 type:complete len:114 (-) Transcript_16585:521-862(-)